MLQIDANVRAARPGMGGRLFGRGYKGEVPRRFPSKKNRPWDLTMSNPYDIISFKQ
jgi:hypothetical protein